MPKRKQAPKKVAKKTNKKIQKKIAPWKPKPVNEKCEVMVAGHCTPNKDVYMVFLVRHNRTLLSTAKACCEGCRAFLGASDWVHRGRNGQPLKEGAAKDIIYGS